MKKALVATGVLLLVSSQASASSPQANVTVNTFVAGVRLPKSLVEASWSHRPSNRESILDISGDSVSGSTTSVVGTWTSGSLRVPAEGLIVATDISDAHNAKAPGLANSSTTLLVRLREGKHAWSKWEVLSTHAYKQIDLPGDQDVSIGFGFVFSEDKKAEIFQVQLRLQAAYQDSSSIDEHFRIRTP